MSELPYMNFFVADYLSDTWTLNTVEHGAYCLLIFSYWKNGGPLPDDDRILAKITRLRTDRFQKVSPQVLSFFARKDGKIVHKRIDEELAKARHRAEMARKAGIASGNARSNVRSTDVQRIGERMGNHSELNKEPELKDLKPKAPIPQQAGALETEKEQPKNSRAHGTNPRALGTNPRAITGKEKADQERQQKLEAQIQREVDDAWAEANAISLAEWRRQQQADEVVI